MATNHEMKRKYMTCSDTVCRDMEGSLSYTLQNSVPCRIKILNILKDPKIFYFNINNYYDFQLTERKFGVSFTCFLGFFQLILPLELPRVLLECSGNIYMQCPDDANAVCYIHQHNWIASFQKTRQSSNKFFPDRIFRSSLRCQIVSTEQCLRHVVNVVTVTQW